MLCGSGEMFYAEAMTAAPHHHESIHRSDAPPKASERSFGIVFTVVFALIGLLPLFSGGGVRIWALAIAALFLILAFAAPNLLKPLNRAWMALGNLLHKIVSPLVLGLLFLIAVVPTGLFLRLSRKDPLRLKLDKSAKTYWQERTPPGPPPGSLKNQF